MGEELLRVMITIHGEFQVNGVSALDGGDDQYSVMRGGHACFCNSANDIYNFVKFLIKKYPCTEAVLNKAADEKNQNDFYFVFGW